MLPKNMLRNVHHTQRLLQGTLPKAPTPLLAALESARRAEAVPFLEASAGWQPLPCMQQYRVDTQHLTSTNFLTPFCAASDTRFFVPCEQHQHAKLPKPLTNTMRCRGPLNLFFMHRALKQSHYQLLGEAEVCSCALGCNGQRVKETHSPYSLATSPRKQSHQAAAHVVINMERA